jgi:hypothetical protein
MKSYSDTAFPLAEAGGGYGKVGEADGDPGAVGCAEPDGDAEALAGDDGDGLVVRPPEVHPASAVPASRVTARVAAGTRRLRRISPPWASARLGAGVRAICPGSTCGTTAGAHDAAPAT